MFAHAPTNKAATSGGFYLNNYSIDFHKYQTTSVLPNGNLNLL